MSTYSDEHKKYLRQIKKEKLIVSMFRIMIIVGFLILWEVLARLKMINTFLFSSPSSIIKTLFGLVKANNLFGHIGITLYEVALSFLIATIIGILVATIFWRFELVSKIMDPYITILNSLPKVALGPLIIIWVGASTNSIIFMALLISTFITIINIYNGFINVNKAYITLMESFKATKWQIFWKVVLPSNYKTILSTLKINVSMSLIGVIMGELLVSKSGLGYLIMYGSQVFNINLVITSVVILGIISYLMYFVIDKFEQKIKR